MRVNRLNEHGFESKQSNFGPSLGTMDVGMTNGFKKINLGG